ncbi:hypothetical protein AJ80_09349 [Polytolypa hystricis UAMH7299]|uniref:Major facilitator superfamily (MFS) profile domain-containing protein n=1 Tax=Polytolypa hystricis (strain UAMH7299) TaxID=1447883 RepID=A0A2B7WJC0_POLH7|nr:hypothetical protein AJ80_09349 [Polytolypa hystricis UAMH7299]
MAFILVTICCAFAALGSFLFGYDTGIIVPSIAQDDFTQHFGEGLNDASVGGIISSFTGGAIIGSAGVSYISDTYGRRVAIFVGGLLATLGAALQGGTINIAMLIAGRFIAGIAIGLMSATIPVYCSEVAPPRIRGLLAGLQQWMLGWGFVVAQWVGFGCSHSQTSFSWRFPLSLQALPGFVLAVGALFLPETPRWLIEHDMQEEGYKVLVRLHTNKRNNTKNSNDNSTGTTAAPSLVELEYKQISDSIALEHSESAHSSWRDLLFNNPTWRHRILLAAGIQALTQCSGINVINYYGPRIYATLGFSTSRSLMIIGISGALAQTWNTVCLGLLDHIGRRKLLIPSMIGMGATLCVEATLTQYFNPDTSSNDHALRAAVAMYFVYSFFFTPLGVISWIYPSEIFPTGLRARGTSVSTLVNWSLNLVFAQCSPIGLSRLGYRFFYCFMAFNWVGALLVWAFYPETVGRSLEEVEEVFEGANGVWTRWGAGRGRRDLENNGVGGQKGSWGGTDIEMSDMDKVA